MRQRRRDPAPVPHRMLPQRNRPGGVDEWRQQAEQVAWRDDRQRLARAAHHEGPYEKAECRDQGRRAWYLAQCGEGDQRRQHAGRINKKVRIGDRCGHIAMLLQVHGNCKERGRHKAAPDPEWCPGRAGLAQRKGPEHQRGHKAAQEDSCPRGKLVKDSLVGNIAGPSKEGGHHNSAIGRAPVRRSGTGTVAVGRDIDDLEHTLVSQGQGPGLANFLDRR